MLIGLSQSLYCSAETQDASNSALVLSTAEKIWIQQHPVITVAVNHSWAPIEFTSEGNEARGISIDYLHRIEKLVGVKFQTVAYTDNPVAENADMISVVTNKETLRKSRFVPLNIPFLITSYSIFVRENSFDLRTIDDLKGKEVAVFKTGQITRVIEAEYPSIRLYKADIAQEALDALMSKKVDAYLGNQLIVKYVAASYGFKKITESGVTPFTSSFTMAVRDDWPELKSILEKSLSALAPQQEEILKNWSIDQDDSYDEQVVIGFGTLGFLIILGLGYRSWYLKRAIHLDQQRSQALIWQHANYDFLTKVPNRWMFHDRLEQEIKKSNHSQYPLALLFLDLDHFKEINDTLGHTVGDELLIEVAKRISSCVREADTVARLGGDEFTIIMSELKDISNVNRITQEILKKLNEPFHLNDQVLNISASIGITIYPNDTSDSDTLLMYADQAMYAAKNRGRNQYHFFTNTMQKAAEERMRITNDLKLALANQQFKLFYQPIIELASHKVVKAEALIRWQHPEYGLINPVQFISIAEETKMISPIGDWVFSTALDFVYQLRRDFNSKFQLCVNVSPLQLQDNAFAMNWLNNLQAANLATDCISMEITEGVLLELNETVKQQLAQIRDMGIQSAIDDFGTGYSSLSYLKKFHIDYIKIDRSFVSHIENDADDLLLCEAIIEMSHKLGFKVVAEGIETEGQLEILKKVGCDFGQGFLFARPMAEDQFKEYLKTYNN